MRHFVVLDATVYLSVVCTAMQHVVTFSSTTICCQLSGLTRRRTLGTFSIMLAVVKQLILG